MNERAIFDEAAEIAHPAQRREYLNHVCADNPALRLRVEALLESHDAVRSFLHLPVADQLAADTKQPREYETVDSHPGHLPDDSDQESGPITLSFLEPSDKDGSL